MKKHLIAILALLLPISLSAESTDKIETLIDSCYTLLNEAQVYINEGNTDNATIALNNIRDIVKNRIEPKITSSVSAGDTSNVTKYRLDLKDIQLQLVEKKLKLQVDDADTRLAKMNDFVSKAHSFERGNQLAFALRYYYAAQVLLQEIPGKESLTLSLTPGDWPINADTLITRQITNILKDIKISFDGFLDENNTEAKFLFTYQGRPVTDLDFSFYDYDGWNEGHSVTDGWSIVMFKPENKNINNVRIKIEYRYEGEAMLHMDLKELFERHNINYDKQAFRVVLIFDKDVEEFFSQYSSRLSDEEAEEMLNGSK